jgi:hypothetical protein
MRENDNVSVSNLVNSLCIMLGLKFLRPSSLILITLSAPYLYNKSEESVGFTEIAVTVSPVLLQ